MRIPRIRLVEWVEGNEVRLFFSSGKVVEVKLPWVEDASAAKVVDAGVGLDPGDGLDVSSLNLCERRGKVLRKGRRGWYGSPGAKKSSLTR